MQKKKKRRNKKEKGGKKKKKLPRKFTEQKRKKKEEKKKKNKNPSLKNFEEKQIPPIKSLHSTTDQKKKGLLKLSFCITPGLRVDVLFPAFVDLDFLLLSIFFFFFCVFCFRKL